MYKQWRVHKVLWEPDSYTANSVEAVMSVAANTLIGPIICRTVEVFNGGGTAAIFELGYGDNVDEFLDAGELEETSISAATSQVIAVGASDGTYDTNHMFLFNAADTIDVNFTANTSGTRTTGQVEITIFWMLVRP